MKYSRKLMVVPFNTNYETPLKQYITNLDNEMNEILKLNLPGDEKLKLYNSLLIKYREYYDVNELTENPQVKNISSLIEKVQEEIKQENKELDSSLKEQYKNINIKLEKFQDEIHPIKLEKELNSFKTNLESVSKKRKVNEKSTKLKPKKVKPREKAQIFTPNPDITFNNSSYESPFSTSSLMDTAILEQKPLKTRSESKQYNLAKELANLNFLKNLEKVNKVNQNFQNLSIDDKGQSGTGLTKISWCSKKYF